MFVLKEIAFFKNKMVYLLKLWVEEGRAPKK